FVSPEWYMANAPFPTVETDLALTVANEIPALVPRFVALPIANVSISPSPLWLQSQLNRLGVRPINNIVDITNYYMVLTGQPLHAYDYDKVKALSGGREAQLIVRKPKAGETIEMLNGKIITPHPDAMMVAAGETLACVGGMIGGANTEVDEHTKNIILEAATWDMFSIRRTSMHHGIFTDAVTRFSKGQSPLQNSAVAAKAALEIKKLTGALIGEAVDDNHVAEDARARASLHAPITTTSDYINVRLGTQLTAEEMAVTLNNVEIAVETHGDQLIITPPFWRTDLEIPEDIVEEIGRLRGYDQLPHELPTRSTHAVPLQPLEDLKNQIRDILAAAGANELQTYSFVPKKLLEDVGQNAEHAFAIRNALSPELQHYRMSLTPGLLDKVHANIKAGYKEFALFEVNKIHIKGKDFEECDGLPREFQTIAFVFASDHPLPGAAYYYAKKYLDYLLAELGVPSDVRPADVEPVFEIGRQIFAPFEPKRAGFVYVGKGEPANFAGFVGEYRGQVAKRLKLPKTVAGFEIDLERLLQHRMKGTYRPILRFPSTDQDVCFKVTADKTYGEVRALVAAALAGNPELRVTIAPLDIYQRSDDQAHKQITFRITLQHAERTLTTDEVNDLLDAVVEHVAATIGAERV
ncbi:MAG TPA: phenylalanine--tRNA ligase subunit beta, partial [Candidatus Saccharimonadales bacterium]|nr:phenylalanine--tRNA ligase subunit beta [Candidatus Saccharimonadales bacterium]